MRQFFSDLYKTFTGKELRAFTKPIYYNIIPRSIFQSNEVAVTEDVVLANTAAWRALTLLGGSQARTVKYLKRKEGDSWIIDEDHYINDVLNFPNEYHTAFEFYETVTGYAALYGNGYAYIVRDAAFRPIKMIPLHPMHVMPVAVKDWFYYDVTLYDGRSMIVEPEDMIHLKALVYDSPNITGKSSYKIHHKDYNLGESSKRYSVNFYENGAHLQGYLHTEEHLTDRETDELSNKFDTATQGTGNIMNTPVLHSGLDYKTVKLTPKDALFIEISQLNTHDISRIFGVPIHLLSELGNSSFNNIIQQSFEFEEYSIEPLAVRWSHELTKKLVPSRKRKTTKIECDTTPLRAGDFEARAAYYTKMHSIGAINANEIRKREGMNPREGGDVFYTLVNVFSDDERELRKEKDAAEVDAKLATINNQQSEEKIKENGSTDILEGSEN